MGLFSWGKQLEEFKDDKKENFDKERKECSDCTDVIICESCLNGDNNFGYNPGDIKISNTGVQVSGFISNYYISVDYGK